MAEEQVEHKKAERTRRPLRWWAGVLMLAVAVVLALVWLSERLTLHSAEQQLAAIEASRAIPDEQNAGLIYTELAATTDLVSNQPRFLGSEGRTEPWLSADHPEAAEWLRKHQDSIARLMQACRKQQCRFPISTDMSSQRQQMWMLNRMRNWAQLLAAAANNDMAEGRIDVGLEKCRCLIQMGTHMQQQLTMIDILVGIAFEALGLHCLNRSIVEGDATEGHLKTIEEALPEVRNNWDRDWPRICEITKLVERCLTRDFGYFRWLISRFRHGVFYVDLETRLEGVCLRSLAQRRGTHLLIALRRYKNANGSWPQDLGVLRDLVRPEILVDPTNGGSFVYKLTQDDFVLYSKGQNNIDENGSRTGTADDRLIWPSSNRRLKERKRGHKQSGAPDG
jgi:hypothetical protein